MWRNFVSLVAREIGQIDGKRTGKRQLETVAIFEIVDFVEGDRRVLLRYDSDTGTSFPNGSPFYYPTRFSRTFVFSVSDFVSGLRFANECSTVTSSVRERGRDATFRVNAIGRDC